MPMNPPEPDDVPNKLRDRDNWIVWREEKREGDDDPTKVPYTAFGNRSDYARSTDPETWTDYETAKAYFEKHSDQYDGVGFVFDADEVIVGIDLDDCRDAETGDVDAWARDVIDSLDSFAEVSPSGEGFHIYAIGIKPGDKAKALVDADDTIHGEPEFEMYDESRYFTFTGRQVDGTPDTLEQRNSVVADLYDEYLAEDEPEPTTETTAEPIDIGDDELLQRIKDSEQGDDFERLWRGDTSMHGHDHSRADLALCGMLAFWTGGDRSRMDSLFRKSGLMRGKWDEDRGSQTYGELTIDKALQGRSEFYEPEAGASSPEPPEEPSDDEESIEQAHTPDIGEWWIYTREVYNEETQKEGRKTAANTLEKWTDWMYVMESDILWVYDADRGYFQPRGRHIAKRILERELDQHFSKNEASEIIARIEARNQTRRKELNARTLDSPLVCVGNGVIDLATGELMDHSPAYKFTRGLGWDYDPERANPEPVVKFLDGVTKREADRDTILDHLAHGLMPGHPYRAFVVMYGPGSNGKTRVGKLLRGFVGEENAASVELQAFTGDDQFATGGLPGAFVNVGDDISVGNVRDTSIIKSLTGDGTLRANVKHEKQYDFENEAAIFFSANEPPRIHEKTDAINDRLYPIEMPFRFVDNPDPDNELEKRKIPGIAESLLNDDGAMRGLLMLAVEHAQKIIDNHGQYSMPEGPAERREMYEAASDPIKRFALEYLESGDESAMIRKVDAFNVYTEMCDDQGERAATEETFKQVVGEMASLDITSTRTRALTPGDNREYAWRYVRFAPEAREYMNDRLKDRYDGDTETEAEIESAETNELGAKPLEAVALDPTGYATVSVDVLTVEEPDAENAPAIKGTVKDSSTAMDIISWEETDALEADGTVLIENAKLTEYDGQTQLTIEPNVTEIREIQTGAGYTAMADPGEDQGRLDDTATDGGNEIADSTGRVRSFVANECNPGETLTAPRVAGQTDMEPARVKSALDKLARETTLLIESDDGWEVL